MGSRKRKILSVFVFVAERSVLGMHGNMDLDLLSWILSRQHSLLIRTESKGPGQERGGQFFCRSANWEPGNLGATPGYAIINYLVWEGSGGSNAISLDLGSRL